MFGGLFKIGCERSGGIANISKQKSGDDGMRDTTGLTTNPWDRQDRMIGKQFAEITAPKKYTLPGNKATRLAREAHSSKDEKNAPNRRRR